MLTDLDMGDLYHLMPEARNARGVQRVTNVLWFAHGALTSS